MSASNNSYQSHSIDMVRHETSTLQLVGIAADCPSGHRIDYHRHARCQLLYAVEGIMLVETSTRRWIVPPTQGVWLCPYVDHRLTMRSHVRIRSLLIDASASHDLPKADGVVHVSPLFRELITEAANLSFLIGNTKRGELLSALLMEELKSPSEWPFHLPWPHDPQLQKVCHALSENPASDLAINEWAAQLAMSPKTFQRHFQQQTGMPFGRWRQQMRLLSSLEMLLGGSSILQVALHYGYESHSAYTLAFKKFFGTSPSQFFVDSRT